MQPEPIAPYLHDRWDDQVALEKEMLVLGSDRVRDRVNKAREKKDMNRLRPYRSLLHEWVLPVSDAIREWIQASQKARGVKPIALPRLKELNHDTASMVALKTILRMLGVETRGIQAIAFEIGTWCEHEARCEAWMTIDPDSWKTNSAVYRKRGSNAAHQKRSRISLFNKYVQEEIGWIGWTDEERNRVGLELIDIVLKTTKRFKVVEDPNWVPKRIKGGAYAKRPYVLDADADLHTWLSAAMDDELVHSPTFMPTIIPPKEWTGPRDGGYWTPFVKTPLLIRFKASHQDQKNQAITEYEALDMPNVYTAINAVQNTAWKINRRVYDVAKAIWDKDLAIAGFPRQEEETVPARPEGVERGMDEFKIWAAKAGEVRTRNATRVSHYLSYRRAFVIAERFLNEPVFYFPHMLDFRGRMYPIPSDISPQGVDLHRGLLTFADGKPIDEEDAQWLAIQVANCFGKDKIPFWERVEWVKGRELMWRRMDKDPLDSLEWSEADDPWQALAAVLEWVRYLKEGPGMISSLPIRVDGTCNGIQHLSAMVRDEFGGESVNMTPGDRPRDIYQEVADIVTLRLKDKLHDPMAVKWLQVFKGQAPRSVTKRPVMILPYGGTKDAYFTYTLDWIRENDPNGEDILKEERIAATSYLIPILWQAVEETVVSAREVMEWLQKCSAEASRVGKPVYWTTPAGFVVRHFYGMRVQRQVKTKIDGQMLQLRDYTISPDLDKAGQARGIAPNFVHSMDASCLMTCINIGLNSGITSYTAIHDAYGTVAADMWKLYTAIREAFIETYNQPVLEQYLQACRYIVPDGKFPKLPAFGKLNLEQIRDADYFFA